MIIFGQVFLFFHKKPMLWLLRSALGKCTQYRFLWGTGENYPNIIIKYSSLINPCPAEPGYTYPAFANSVDPDQLASEEAN